MLVGREAECARLAGLLAEARLGRSGSIVIRGDPGVGKTALLDYVIQEADGFDVLHVAGMESEAELPYGGLHALLRPLVGLIAGLPELQARALRVALALEQGDPDAFVAAAGALTLLAEAAERRPILVAVDDAHWLDRASAQALLFVARRLEAERIANVLVVREGEAGFERHALPEIVVTPLDDDSAFELLRERWGELLAPAVARQLVAVTDGNPLALAEVAQGLTAEERLGHAPLAEPLPVTAAIEREVRRKLAELPSVTRAAVVLAALDEGATEVVDLQQLVPAERLGLVRLHRGRIVFVHPLFRAAVSQSVSPEERRTTHWRLAESLTRAGDEDLRAWHLAAAADGTDELAAAALEAAADRAEARGGTAARARALERAAALSEDTNEGARRLIAAAAANRVAGHTHQAKELLERLLPTIEDPLLHADLVQELQAIADWTGPPMPIELIEAEADNVAPLDPERAAKLLGSALPQYSEHDLDIDAMNRIAERIEPLIPHLGDWWRGRAIGWLAQARLLRGDTQRAIDLFTQMLDDPLAAATQAPSLVRLELYDEARSALDASLELGRSAGQALRVAWTQACFGQLEKALDRYPQAIAAAAEASAVSEEIEAYSVAVTALLVTAEIAAEQGREEDCRGHAARVDELGTRLVDEYSHLAARLPLAKAALVAGRYAEVVALLQPVAERCAAAGIKDPTYIPYAPDLIEAYARLGEPVKARAELDRFSAQAAAAGRSWALASAARCEGILAADDGFDEWFAEALGRHARVPSRFGEARTRLCYGERLRRVRRRRDAREQLRPALEVFEAVGAAPWAARARAELEATGEKIPRRDPTAPERLTPQELQIALQVAEGKTNREVAAALFLSPKTVEHHLTHAYRKLDLHSRAELIRLFVTEPVYADAASSASPSRT